MEKKILTLFIFLMFFAVTAPLYAKPPSGGGAPLGGGLFVLLGLGAAYAGKKIYDYKKREPEG